MRVSHAASDVSARFDDPNLVSCAGLASALSLARRCGLHGLVAGHVRVRGGGGANPHLKVPGPGRGDGRRRGFTDVGDQLADATISVLTLDRILGSIRYLPLNVGQAWGHLRIFPTDKDDLRPTDIVVFDELPLDLFVVAGVLTRAVQDTNSHVNLKSKERNTPNAVLRDAGPDVLQAAPWPQALAADTAAVDTVLRIIEQRATLLGFSVESTSRKY